MSEPSFEELQRLWQAPPAAIAPAQQIILRQRRRRWLSRLYLISEIVATIAGIPFAIWLALQPRALLPGVGLLVVVVFAAGASLWARSVRQVRVEDPLLASIEQGVSRARVGVRLAYAGLWAMAASMIFVAAVSFVWMSAPDLSVERARRVIIALIIWSGSFALWLAATIPYLVHRSRDLVQMERARDAINGQG